MKKLLIFLSSVLFAFEISTPAFKNGSLIPQKFTCDGENISPEIIIKDIPKDTKSIAIVMQDPDAPNGVFTHWILYSINPKVSHIPQNIPKKPVTNLGLQGINSFGITGYSGPCPPYRQTHRYFISAIALNKEVKLKPNLTIIEFLDKIRPFVTAVARYEGIYKRSTK